MNLISNLKLRGRIMRGYAISVPLFLVVAVLVSVTLKQVERDQLAAAKLDDLHYIHLAVSEMARAERGYLLSQEPKYIEIYEAAQKNYKNTIEALRKKEKAPEQLEIIDDMEEKAVQIEGISSLLLTLVKEGKLSLAVEQFKTGEAPALFQVLISDLDQLEKAQRQRLNVAQGQTSTSLFTLTISIWGGTLLVIILALGIGTRLAKLISQPIISSVNTLSNVSSEIAATINQHERTVVLQTASVNEITVTSEELGASARTSAEQAEATTELANRSLKVTEEGQALVNRAYAGMETMKEKMGAIAGQILHLSEQAEQIGAIAKVVGELASETNMLALNAAVEAARAGEHGKGFAVVASEVRKLAVQSKKSAERADELVGIIQKATNSAVMVAEDGSKTVDEVAAISRQAGVAFDTLAGVAQEVYQNSQQVMLNSTQQAAALAQVAEAMKGMNAGAQEMAAGTAQTKIGIQKLNDVSQELKKMV